MLNPDEHMKRRTQIHRNGITCKLIVAVSSKTVRVSLLPWSMAVLVATFVHPSSSSTAVTMLIGVLTEWF